ncbi:LD-carboxypeptidase [Priestia megaterium]|nr:LD-carboxypeptidase [Priestia megaterium]
MSISRSFPFIVINERRCYDKRLFASFKTSNLGLIVIGLGILIYKLISNKWVLGYSDTSLLLASTLNTGIATAHGTNFVDLRGEYWDDTTSMWEAVLSTKIGHSVCQTSSAYYQKTWQHDNSSPCVFHLTEKTDWKTIDRKNAKIEGRLLGGCIDTIRHLVGTPFGNAQKFRKQFISGEPILWYFENCELTTVDLHRSLVQMKLAGWFKDCSGILFGRSAANQTIDGYTAEDVYRDLANELEVPIVYDIDCGHVPPQVTLINGAHAEVTVAGGQGTVIQSFML